MKATGVSFDEAVALDIDEAAFWYETEFGAGAAFLDAFDATVDRILHGPLKYRVRRERIRVAHVRSEQRTRIDGRRGPEREFPHGVYFEVDAACFVRVWAVASLTREPYYWLGRLPEP